MDHFHHFHAKEEMLVKKIKSGNAKKLKNVIPSIVSKKTKDHLEDVMSKVHRFLSNLNQEMSHMRRNRGRRLINVFHVRSN